MWGTKCPSCPQKVPPKNVRQPKPNRERKKEVPQHLGYASHQQRQQPTGDEQKYQNIGIKQMNTHPQKNTTYNSKEPNTHFTLTYTKRSLSDYCFPKQGGKLTHHTCPAHTNNKNTNTPRPSHPSFGSHKIKNQTSHLCIQPSIHPSLSKKLETETNDTSKSKLSDLVFLPLLLSPCPRAPCPRRRRD